MDGAGHLRGAPQPPEQRVHPALGIPHAPALLDPPSDLGRRPEPPGRHLVAQLRLLLRRQERRRTFAPGVPSFQRRQPANPVLLGGRLCTQAVSATATQLGLTNALDLTLGSF